jgi:hypothetical protein
MMMKCKWLILLVVIVAGCTNKSKIPSGILGKEKMEKVLWDMVLADRFAAQFIVKDSAKINATDSTFKLYSVVFSMNDISREDFVKSYKFYLTRPDLSKVIFDTISQRANRLKEESYRPKLTKPLDSLRMDSLKK